MTFRFRPECLHDVEVLIDEPGSKVSNDEIVSINLEESKENLINYAVGGAIFSFEAKTPADLARILGEMMLIEDGHRMWQTLDTEAAFTGDAFEGDAARGARILEALGDADPKVAAEYRELMDLPAPEESSPAI